MLPEVFGTEISVYELREDLGRWPGDHWFWDENFGWDDDSSDLA